jgi:hypothetical protein
MKIGKIIIPHNTPLMADGAVAISNGFKEAGFHGIRGMCWFYVIKNIKPRLLKLRNKEHASEIRFDLEKAHCAATPAIFRACLMCFTKKWAAESVECGEFISYFTLQWMDDLMNWNISWNHHVGLTPCTYNGNESLNALIKREDTLRQSINLPTFLHVMLRYI